MIEAAGNVRVGKRTGSLGLLAPTSRVADEAAEFECKDMTWLDRRVTGNALVTSSLAAVEAAVKRKAAIPEMPVIDHEDAIPEMLVFEPMGIPEDYIERAQHGRGRSRVDVEEFEKGLRELAAELGLPISF